MERRDNAVNGNHGTLNGNPAWQPAGGKAGGALQFDGKETKHSGRIPYIFLHVH